MVIISLNDAQEILRATAAEYLQQRTPAVEDVPLVDALNRRVAHNYTCPIPLPPFNICSSGGYAISSETTKNASPDNPVVFSVKGAMGTGEDPIRLSSKPEGDIFPCIEISRGARFPESNEGSVFDACVKVDGKVSGVQKSESGQIIVTRPVIPNAYRRMAGDDLPEGQMLIEKGQYVRPRHILAMGSTGMATVQVICKLRAAVWSAGNDILNSRVSDGNGPFLTAILRESGVDTDFMGVLNDTTEGFKDALQAQMQSPAPYDFLVTNGAMSRRKDDVILPALAALGATMRFDGVALRPGYPVLFATVDTRAGILPIFGLTGISNGAAVAAKSLVTPFIRALRGQAVEQPELHRVTLPDHIHPTSLLSQPESDCFRYGLRKRTGRGEYTVELQEDASATRLAPLLHSNCWIHVPRGQSALNPGELYRCYPQSSVSPD
ncbi:MoeA N-terminal region-like protein [Amniculicola lignicola CBS 123094]|uniref:molybdopterin adenylyltransferase n=1 Tax=Amniculicola lignicola CBS 123094 TaxID=1392246 RepID=A0A6A5VXC0_9PLEO|nr:MoeA N-terminal region-like protein [Amniculicola lignicola CBS 123094]